MAISALITSPTAQARGTHPSLLHPQHRADGMVVRLGCYKASPQQILALSEILCASGGARISVTAEGQLELAGIDPDHFDIVAEALTRILPDSDFTLIAHSPLLGEDSLERADTASLVAALRSACAKLGPSLGASVRVVVDGKGAIDLSALPADVRLTPKGESDWDIALGGSKPQRVDFQTAIGTTIALLCALAALGPKAKAEDLFLPYGQSAASPALALATHSLKGIAPDFRALALPAPGLSQTEFQELAKAAQAEGMAYIRFAPNHTLLLDKASAALIATAQTLGFQAPAMAPFEKASQKLGWSFAEVLTITLGDAPLETVLAQISPGARVLVALRDSNEPQKLASLLAASGFGRSLLTVIDHAGQEHETVRTQMAEFFKLEDVSANCICAISLVALPPDQPTSGTATGPWG